MISIAKANLTVAKYDGWEEIKWDDMTEGEQVQFVYRNGNYGQDKWKRDGYIKSKLSSYASLDKLIAIWEKLDVEYSQFYPQSSPKIWFKIGKHINQDETKTWTGKGKNLREAALLATAMMIEELYGRV